MGIFFYFKEELAGFAFGKTYPEDKKSFLLYAIGLDEKFRGLGYSKKILKTFLKEVFENTETKKIVLHFRDSKNLEKYYVKFGFGNHNICGKYKNDEPKHYMDISRDDIMRLYR